MIVIATRGKSILAAVSIALIVAACGGGSSSAPAPTPTSHTVDISWDANREAAVNTTGGGYKVAISGQAVIDVPYVSGATAPTTKSTTLMSGSYTVTVTAYSALNSGSTSLPSTSSTITVPY